MRMALGVNMPYTDRPWPRKTWNMLSRLGPDEITLTSFADEQSLVTLAVSYPDALYHVRPRVGPQNRPWSDTYDQQGADILSYRSWDTERTMGACLDTLLHVLPRGRHPRGGSRVTVLMGNEPTLEWAPEYPDSIAVKKMAAEYAAWFNEQVSVLRRDYGATIDVAVAPAAEGDDLREMLFITEVHRLGCYDRADRFADHNYFAVNDGEINDTRWGARAIRAMQVIRWPTNSRGRARNTETNDNGDLRDAPAGARASAYAEYVTWAAASGAYESVSLFTLPGAPDDKDKPSWWFLTNEMIDAVKAAREGFPELDAVDIPEPTGPVDPVKPIEPPDTGGTMPTDPLTEAVRGGQKLTADQLHAKRWAAHALPKLPEAPAFNASFGFETAWRRPENLWWGSPLTIDEDQLLVEGGDPLPARVFTNAVVVWRPGSGTEVLG